MHPNNHSVSTNIHNLIGLEEVPIGKIIEAAQAVGGNNNFLRLLETAQAYSTMGVDPIFLVNKDQSAIRVAAREIYEHPHSLN